MNNFIKNLVIALVGLLLLGFGFLGGYHMKEPEVVPVTVEKEVPKIVYVNRTVEVPVIRYVNNTIVKEVPKEIVKTVEKKVIEDPVLDFKNSIVEYLKVNFSECEGFNFSGFAEEEINLYDVDDIEFTVKYDDDSNVHPEFYNITALAKYKYKAEDLPREYHNYQVTISYDNDDKEIVDCVMNETE